MRELCIALRVCPCPLRVTGESMNENNTISLESNITEIQTEYILKRGFVGLEQNS